MIKYSKHHAKAIEALKVGDERQAEKAFKQAVRSEPRNVNVLADYARLLLQLYRFDEAVGWIRKAGSIGKWGEDVALAAGRIAMEARKPEQALKFLKLGGESRDCLLEEAKILERSNELSNAKDVLNRYEVLGGDNAESMLLKARLDFRLGHFTKSLETLESLRGKVHGHPVIMAQVHYARGTAMDKVGDFAGAFGAWEQAKECLKPMSVEAARGADEVLKMGSFDVEQLTSETLLEWKSWEGGEVRSIMISGYPRSGTTLLENRLEKFTGYRSADENRAFAELVSRRSSGLGHEAKDRWAQLSSRDGIDQVKLGRRIDHVIDYQNALRSLAGVGDEAKLVFDKNPQFLLNVPTMLRYMPSMPVVMVRRDPRDVMLSCFSQSFGLNAYSVNYLTMGQTARHLAVFRKLGEKLQNIMGDQMVVCDYEELVNDEEGVVRRVSANVLKSAGVEAEKSEDHKRMTFSPTYAEVAKPVHGGAVGKWENYRKWIEPHLEPLESIL